MQVTLWAVNPWGCNDSTFVTIVVKEDFELFAPNTFTPDGDEHNNTFFAKGHGISDEDYTFRIFNRWGQLVFESHDMNVGWDGNSMNRLESAQDGTYTWVVYFKDMNNGRHRREGHVNLLK
jgi:gliding motility-associated-like protein